MFRFFESLAAASVFRLRSKIQIIWWVRTVRRDDIVVPVSCPVGMAATIAGLTRLRSGQNVSTIKFVLCRHPRLHLQGVINPVKLTEILFYVDSVCWSFERPRVVNGCSLYLFLSSEFLFAMAGDNAAAVQRELEDMREAVKSLAEQTAESKRQAKKVMLDKAVTSVK